MDITADVVAATDAVTEADVAADVAAATDVVAATEAEMEAEMEAVAEMEVVATTRTKRQSLIIRIKESISQKSLMDNESAAKQTTDLLKSSPTLRNIISPFIKGNDTMHIRIGKTDDPDAIMDTDRDNGDLTINEKHVDKSGFNFKAQKGEVDNGGYAHLGTVEDSFAACIGHECLHEKHFYWFREARRQGYTSENDCLNAVKFLQSHGFSNEFIHVYYSNNGGKWIENPKDQMDKNEHDYIRKYDVDEIRRISKEYRTSLLEFHPGQD